MKSPFSGMATQAWVLRSDGTALPSRIEGHRAPVQVTVNRGGDPILWRKMFMFKAAEQEELVAVVVSLNGVPLVRPIPHTSQDSAR
jgi:hypothetical protein